MSRPSKLLIPLTIAGMALLTASPIASAQEPPDDPPSISAEPTATLPIEMTWLSSGAVPATDQVASAGDERPSSDADDDAVADAVAATANDRVVSPATSADLGATAPTDADGAPIPLDDLISNYGCMMVEGDPGEHLGVNCIDDGWLNTDGTVYVHTTVPAAQQVRFSSSPPTGTTETAPLTSPPSISTPPRTTAATSSRRSRSTSSRRTPTTSWPWPGTAKATWPGGTGRPPSRTRQPS